MSEPCIYIVDDDEMIRRALSFSLGEAGFEVRAYASARQFLAVADDLEPGCVVTDVLMPGMNGVELVEQLKGRQLAHVIVVMSGYADISRVVEAMKAGAADFLQKPFKPADLIEAVRGALASRRAEAAAADEAASYRKLLAGLTPRQSEILRALSEGKGTKAIARELGISPRTVDVHRAEIKMKTGAGSSTELVRMAVMAGLAGS
jgi:two-component system response regulator FixJ